MSEKDTTDVTNLSKDKRGKTAKSDMSSKDIPCIRGKKGHDPSQRPARFPVAVSVKSDGSKADPPYFPNEPRPTHTKGHNLRHGFPVAVSVKSDGSIADPPYFPNEPRPTHTKSHRLIQRPAGVPAHSSVSVKSDGSKADPLYFTQTVKSDGSKADPLYFSPEPQPIHTKGHPLRPGFPAHSASQSVKSDGSKADPLYFTQSVKSDGSKADPLYFSPAEPQPIHTKLKTPVHVYRVTEKPDDRDIVCGVPKYWQRVGKPHKENRPDDYVDYKTESEKSSKDIPLHSNVKKTKGSPAVRGRSDESGAVPINLIKKQDRLGRRESTLSDTTSDYSSDRTTESGDGPPFGDDTLPTEVFCDVCRQSRAMKTCLTCDMSYCEYHVRQHYTVEAMQRHRLCDVTWEAELGKRCQHYGEPLELFCMTDQMLICSICSERNHKGHDVLVRKDPHGSNNRVVPPPGEIRFRAVKPDSVILTWGGPEGPEGPDGPKTFRVRWSSTESDEVCTTVTDCFNIEITNLKVGRKYYFSVATQEDDDTLSAWVNETVFTAVPAPRNVTVEHSDANSMSLKWTRGEAMEQIRHQFLITVRSPGREPLAIHTEDCFKIFTDLEPDTEYSISVSTVLTNQRRSETVTATIRTKPCLMEVLSKIGLEDQYENKLTLSTILEIDRHDMSGKKTDRMESLPGAFLKKLMMANADARCVSLAPSDADNSSSDASSDSYTAINPLDLTTAVFLCSDALLQQTLVQKMSLCQFAIPLLLPNHETREITLMLWSMRDIVRKFSPSYHAFNKSFVEERLVLSQIPLVSFVRQGKSNFSKSSILNKLLSNPQQHHDTFCHRNMACCDIPKRISGGLVEIAWYLPCGNRNVDRFTDPVAVANLRGDIRVFDKQFSFLCQTSAAVYIFCDDTQNIKMLEGIDMKAEVFLITTSLQGKFFTLKKMVTKPSLKTITVCQKKWSEEDMVKALQTSVATMLGSCPSKTSVENMAKSARHSGILVDEDSEECQSARKNAGKITRTITTAAEFKSKQLPSQGSVWKGLSWLEKESYRLRKAGRQNVDHYRSYLKTQEKEHRRKQERLGKSPPMADFLHGVVTSEAQRSHFLRWLEMDLENLSRQDLSGLRDQYADLRQKSPQAKERIAELDKNISDCCLGLEHFFRECGQLYNYTSYLPEYSQQRKVMEHLPAHCAQMLLDGFPVELIDGDASNIPMKWITDVLAELRDIMHSKSNVKVVTILGAENTGKSTLLNTMFGLRFGVGGGRCTRGAYLQLIGVGEDVRKELGCDCLMVIDTEGLKPHQMSQEDGSHERDKEVASLAAGLSDVVIVNISEDSAVEMKDVLEIVVHTLVRMHDKGKRPVCHFVHTNKSDVPTRKRKERETQLSAQLEQMIVTASRAERKHKITKISDLIEYDPDANNWYLPKLWRGTPPMAPLSVSYSETVYVLKKKLMRDLKLHQEKYDLTDFIQSTQTLWKTIMYEESPCGHQHQ